MYAMFVCVPTCVGAPALFTRAGISCLHLPGGGVRGGRSCLPGIYVGDKGMNSGPQACMVSALPRKPSP